jgi:hypothetical protein
MGQLISKFPFPKTGWVSLTSFSRFTDRLGLRASVWKSGTNLPEAGDLKICGKSIGLRFDISKVVLFIIVLPAHADVGDSNINSYIGQPTEDLVSVRFRKRRAGVFCLYGTVAHRRTGKCPRIWGPQMNFVRLLDGQTPNILSEMVENLKSIIPEMFTMAPRIYPVDLLRWKIGAKDVIFVCIN